MENIIDHIIVRVFSGEASSKDILYLSDWLNEDERHQQEFCKLKNYWDAEISMNHSILPALSMEKLQQKIERQNKVAPKTRMWKYIISLAASIILLFTLSVGYILTQSQKNSYKYYTYLTNDNKTDFTMDDGTQITLNKNSRLTYTNAYGEKLRSVRLEGEGYFDVAKDSLKPFRIIMGNSSITVLGTTFNLRNDIKSNNVTATLVEGSICFEAPGQKVLLKPGQQLTFNEKSNSIDIMQVNTDKYTYWKSGLLKYKSIPFFELVEELKNKYQIEIVVENKKLKKRDIVVSGTFSEDQNIEQILKVISHSLPLSWRYDNGVYYIK